MPRILFAVAVGGCFWSATPLRAGLYSLVEEDLGPGAAKEEITALSFGLFQDHLMKLLSVGIEQPQSKLREHYLARRAELEKKNRFGGLTVEEKINLSECLIRLRQYDAAIELLVPLARQDRTNFLVQANLATAYQLTNQLRQAIDAQEQVKAAWPRERKGWTGQQLQWYGRVETYQAKLVRLRFRESKQPGGPPNVAKVEVDDLFGVGLIGASDRYQAGRLVARNPEKLPPDALAIVQQLLVWMPEDTRLYWLMGELLNAQGDLAGAAQVLDQCSWSRRFGAEQLREHRQIVQEALAKITPTETPAPDPAGWLPDRSHLIVVGGLACVVVVLLTYLQIREMRLRRRGKSIASKGG
jgi:tetratricopeptide (TPR) repeat protein